MNDTHYIIPGVPPLITFAFSPWDKNIHLILNTGVF